MKSMIVAALLLCSEVTDVYCQPENAAVAGMLDTILGSRLPRVDLAGTEFLDAETAFDVQGFATEGVSFIAVHLGLLGALDRQPFGITVVKDWRELAKAVHYPYTEENAPLGVNEGSQSFIRLDAIQATSHRGPGKRHFRETWAALLTVHELCHAVMDRVGRNRLPLWLDEGISYHLTFRFAEMYRGDSISAGCIRGEILSRLSRLSARDVSVIVRDPSPRGKVIDSRPVWTAAGLAVVMAIVEKWGSVALGKMVIEIGKSTALLERDVWFRAIDKALDTTPTKLQRVVIDWLRRNRSSMKSGDRRECDLLD